MILKAHNNFRLEVIRLLKLYNAGVLAFTEEAKRTWENIHFSESDINPQDPVYLQDNNEDKYLIAGNMYELADKFKKRFQSNLREVLLVRLISALEVFLIDMVKEIFLKRKDLFHSGQKIEFNHGELLSSENITILWSKLINKECRKLQNQGFIEVKKFYKKIFNIDFNKFGDKIGYIEFLHDQRHLLVHRLGKTDKQFQHKYNTTDRTIKISDNDFYEGVETIKSFGEFILNEYWKLSEETKKLKKNSNKRFSYIEIYIINEETYDIIQGDFVFIVEEQIIRLKDIIHNINHKGNNVEIKLYGEYKIIKNYFKLIKGQEKVGNLKIINKNISRSNKTTITDNDIKKVKKLLPEKEPYPIDIHKTIAEELKMKNSKVYEIIGMLMK